MRYDAFSLESMIKSPDKSNSIFNIDATVLVTPFSNIIKLFTRLLDDYQTLPPLCFLLIASTASNCICR